MHLFNVPFLKLVFLEVRLAKYILCQINVLNEGTNRYFINLN